MKNGNKKTGDKRWTYTGNEEMCNVRVSIPKEMWLAVKEHAMTNHRPASAQLRLFLQKGMG